MDSQVDRDRIENLRKWTPTTESMQVALMGWSRALDREEELATLHQVALTAIAKERISKDAAVTEAVKAERQRIVLAYRCSTRDLASTRNDVEAAMLGGEK